MDGGHHLVSFNFRLDGEVEDGESGPGPGSRTPLRHRADL